MSIGDYKMDEKTEIYKYRGLEFYKEKEYHAQVTRSREVLMELSNIPKEEHRRLNLEPVDIGRRAADVQASQLLGIPTEEAPLHYNPRRKRQ